MLTAISKLPAYGKMKLNRPLLKEDKIMSNTAKLFSLITGLCAIGISTNSSADTGCYRNQGMERNTYWCYATEPGESVSCLQIPTPVPGTNPGIVGSPTDRVIGICASGASRSCMDNGNPAATRIQCSPT
jgi:hypothetical protein